jgi:hypothetical protein
MQKSIQIFNPAYFNTEIMIEKLWQVIGKGYKHLLRQGKHHLSVADRGTQQEAASLRAEQRAKIALYDILSGNAREGGEKK